MALGPRQRRRLTFETCEDRIALSATPWQATAFRGRTPLGQQVSTTDNTTHTARNLGVIRQPLSLRNEYVGPRDTRDVFRFELQQTASTQVALHELSSDADVYLLNGDRQIVAASRNGGRLAEQLELQLQPGEYFVVVQNYDSWRGTGYQLDIAADLQPPDRIGNSFRTAKNLGTLRGELAYAESVGPEDDRDVFRFQVNEPTRWQASLRNLRADVDLRLFSATGQQLVSSDLPGISNENIDAWLAPGVYYLVVDAYANASSPYALAISAAPVNLPAPTDPAPTDPAPDAPSPVDPDDELPEDPELPSVPPDAPSSGPVTSGPLAEVSYFGEPFTGLGHQCGQCSGSLGGRIHGCRHHGGGDRFGSPNHALRSDAQHLGKRG